MSAAMMRTQLPAVNGSLCRQLTAVRSQHSITLSPLPDHAQVVIAGAGMIGNAIAYHLVKKGWNDIVIIDKGSVADGTSKYGSGEF